MQRISVAGNSGSGKTTIARAVAERLGVPHLELDSVFHQPDWQELPIEDFRRAVSERAAGDAWVIDGNYRARVADLIWSRADTVVWLDYPRRLVMTRMVRRTFGRLLLGRELWNGNKESLRNALSWNPQTSIIRWAWTHHHEYGETYAAAMTDPANAALTFVRLRHPREAAAWLASLSPTVRRG